MKKTLTFHVTIKAPRPLVWEMMLDPEGYKKWTEPFCQGSYFNGSWEQGARIQFLTPSEDGMTGIIAENRPEEFLSIRHMGEISKGVEDTTSEKVRAWAPAYENYTLDETPDGCRVTATLETVSEYEAFMLTTFPKALSALKDLCEQETARRGN